MVGQTYATRQSGGSGGARLQRGGVQDSSCRRGDGLLPTPETESPLGVVEPEANP